VRLCPGLRSCSVVRFDSVVSYLGLLPESCLFIYRLMLIYEIDFRL
jgi:hypothetical protein